jgi:hypothetical protein
MGTNGFGELNPSDLPLFTLLIPQPSLPSFHIQIKDPYSQFFYVYTDVMEAKEMFNLRNPLSWINTIKFMHIQLRTTMPLVHIPRRVVLGAHGKGRMVAKPQE